ncbi:hypothetical protein LguiB_036131 [Lonicera macranthoides]
MEDFGLEWRCRAVFDGDFILPHDPNRRIANDVEIAVSAFYSKKTEPSMKLPTKAKGVVSPGLSERAHSPPPVAHKSTL